MNQMVKRVVPAVLAMVMMVAASWIGKAAQPTIRMADSQERQPLGNVFPDRIGDWVIDRGTFNVPLPPDVAAQVGSLYTEVVDRTYVNASGQRMMVTVAYGRDQSDGFKVHRPEVCYAAQGFTVGAPQNAGIDLGGTVIPVKRVSTYKEARLEPVTYWMVIGDQVVESAFRHKMAQIGYALHGVIADGLLVRVSSFAPNEPASFEAQAEFVRQWMRLVPLSQRERVFGKQTERM